MASIHDVTVLCDCGRKVTLTEAVPMAEEIGTRLVKCECGNGFAICIDEIGAFNLVKRAPEGAP